MMPVANGRADISLALVSGLPSSTRYSRLILMLQAYFDGSTESGSVLIFAGYLGSVDTWLAFSDEWGELLTLHPLISHFKMSAIGTSQMERAMFHYKLIERSQIFGIAVAIPIEPLTKVVKELGLDSEWANPYYFAWRSVMTLTLQGKKILGFTDPVEFVFDEQTDKKQVIMAWDYFYGSAPMLVRQQIRGAPSFKDDKDVVALQAADLFAWWARKQYLVDKTNMKALFPAEWTKGKDPHMLFAEVTEEGFRTQFLKDIAMAKSQTTNERACKSHSWRSLAATSSLN